MSYFLREIVARDAGSDAPSQVPSSTKISEDYADLIRKFHQIPPKGHPLRIPLSKDPDVTETDPSNFPAIGADLAEALNVVGAPSSFATMAIAKNLLAKYGRLLADKDDSYSLDDPAAANIEEKRVENAGKADQLTSAGLTCVFDVLRQLSKRDPELCVQALTSLLGLLQNMPVDGLRNEPRASIDNMMDVLRSLREEGSPSVCSRSSACLAAIAVAAGQPHQIMAAVQTLICTQRTERQSMDSSYDSIQMPDNLHRLCLKVQHKIYQGQDGHCTWTALPVSEHRLLCSFDLPRLPFDSPSDTPDDDMRLHGGTACDGGYLYVLNYVGLYKLGTGLQETILGRLYASNHGIKATKNCMLTFCNSSLYLRRGQSSCICVIDIDSLRDIGEVVLPASIMQSALFSDGLSFYIASINQQSTLTLTPLNDSFVPSSDSKMGRKFRLTDVAYHCMGDTRPTPHQLPLNLPTNLHRQAVDLHMGRDIAFLQSRAGKVFYAGSGTKCGLQETGTTWMELVLPEPVVQMSVGLDRVLFRSGSGHVWVAGGDPDRRRTGKLRRLQTPHRRKVISVCSAGNSYCYVLENGRVHMGGRHGMRTHPETGLVNGLDGVHMVTVSLGKTHAVAISRHGHLYTWGLNNLYQCGRTDHQTGPSTSVSPRHDRKSSVAACSPTEHLWVKDIASICLQCGLCSSRGSLCPLGPSKGSACACGAGETACLRCGLCRPCGELPGPSTAPDERTPARAILSPARVMLVKGAPDVKVSSISCGNFHTIVLAADRRVFAFGSNCHGQLGCGDARSRNEPVQVMLPTDVHVVQVAAGSNHSVLRTSDGAVYTFGAHKHGQLARPSGEFHWHCIPARVPGFGPGQPSFASWAGAAGDCTLIQSHKALLANDDVADAQIVATKNDLFVFPRHIGADYVAIRRKMNTFSHHQLGPNGLYTSWCLEPRFDHLWSYNAAEMRVEAHTVYSAGNAEDASEPLDDLSFLRCPEFAVPHDSPLHCSSTQLGISLLSSLFAVSTICKSSYWTDKTYASTPSVSDPTTPDGYAVVSRFEGTGGGWGYSAHSVEAIQFMASKDVKLLGIGLYGGRGEYIAKLKLFRLLGVDTDEQYVEHVTESDEALFDCGQRETAALMLAQPVMIRANQWHVLSAKIGSSGPSSDCGANGRPLIECDDVTFHFRNSSLSNNGTDVNVGQIPELYYQIDNPDSTDQNVEPDCRVELTLSRLVSPTSLDAVTPSMFSSMLAVLDWCLHLIFEQTDEGDERLYATERASAIALMILRLFSRYFLLVYPSDSVDEPSTEYAQQLCDLHEALMALFHNANDVLVDETYCHRLVLAEAVRLFLSLSHCLMSSRNLTLSHLAQVMGNDVGDVHTAAVLGCLVKKKKLLDVFLRDASDEIFPRLSSLLLTHFPMERDKVTTLTSFTNILRFLYDTSFSTTSGGKHDVSLMAQDIVVKISEELVIPHLHMGLGPTVQQSPSRFRRRSSQSAWDMSDSSPDAISLKVEVDGMTVHGIGVYLQSEADAKKTWNCEIFRLGIHGAEQWESIAKATCDLTPAGTETGVIRLTPPLPLKAGTTYAVKVWTPENGTKTYCGEGGVSHVRLHNGVRLHFNSCSLSENGTTLQRGQIPFVLYSIETKTPANGELDQELVHQSFLLLLRLLSNSIGASLTNGSVSQCSRSLVSRISGHVMVFMERNQDKTIEIMATLEQLMPLVSSANGAMKASTLSESFDRDSDICETKAMQIVVESPHPYKANNVHSMVVGFDQSVDFMCVQFHSMCETSQADDQLWIYLGVQRECYTPIGRYFGSRDWPRTPLLLPGNSLWFVLESNAEIEGVTQEQMYGFHCTITGYPLSAKDSGLRLEQELAWLSASACRILVQLPSDPSSLSHLSIAEDETRLLLEKHGSLLKKGLSLAHVPTLNELISRGLPPSVQTQDVLFLREFVHSNPSTTPGLLARWLPTGPVVDPARCQLTISQGEIVVGKKVSIRVQTKDQFDRQVVCPQMLVEANMTTGSSSGSTSYVNGNISGVGLMSQAVVLQNPFQPVLLNRARYMSISAMPAYADFSYEEIRLAMAKETVHRDIVKLKHKKNSTFIADWIPTVPGVFRVECKVDGFDLSHTYTVHVADREVTENDVKLRREHRAAQLSRAQLVIIPALADFQSIRMRSSPSLTSACIGTIPRGGSLSFIEELENDDGRWLRLTDETAVLYGAGSAAAGTGPVWCLAYHNHLRRELIPTSREQSKEAERHPTRRTDDHPAPPSTSTSQSVVIDTNEMYILEAGESLPVYTRPSPESIIEGDKMEGRREIASDGWVSNQYGVWIRMAGTQRYILAESSVGRSSIHSQSFSANGNDDEESPPPRNAAGTAPLLPALRPSVADCCRAVFAAFLWHEHLVKDAMAAAAYLKFHQHLHNIWSSAEHIPTTSAPPALQPIVRLWKEVCQAVQASVDQHLIMPPSVGKVTGLPNRRRDSSIGAACELCEDSFKVPTTVHMRMAHPGCGGDTQGYGYNSNGKFTTGWTGDCGTGGRPGSTWYLLCTACRNQYLRKTPAGHRQERTRRWREFRLSATAFEARPEVIIKQNALFLLDLNSSLECDSKSSSTSSGWTINLFPTHTPSPMNRSTMIKNKLDSSQLARSSFMAQSMCRAGHCSDPGPKGQLMSPPTHNEPTTSLGGYRAQHTYEAQEGQEVLQSPSAASGPFIPLRPFDHRYSQATSHGIRRRTSQPQKNARCLRAVHSSSRWILACLQSLELATQAGIIRNEETNETDKLSRKTINNGTVFDVAFGPAYQISVLLLDCNKLVNEFPLDGKTALFEVNVSDIIFQYLTALSSYHRLTEGLPSHEKHSKVLPHPWRLCFLAGPLAGKMVQQLHSFLYTIAVILQSQGVDAKLRSLCFKAWTIQLTAHEQELLILTCNILATVGGVLSDGSASGNWVSASTERSRAAVPQLETADVKDMVDVTSSVKVEASSRQAMVVCLSDGSNETFWESGEEDKSRARSLSVRLEGEAVSPILMALFIDNVRDDAYKTTAISFRASLTDGTRKELQTRAVEPNFCGWIKCCIAGTNYVQVVMKGPHNALRVRQLMVLGFCPRSPQEVLRPSTSHQLFFSNTQLDAFALFQAISAQAFGGELSEDQQGTLRERVVDLLCSRVQLQPLQNYVGTQVVNALEREVDSLCLQSKRNYSYACGLLDMLVRICQGSRGGQLFAAKNTILCATSQLIIFAPQVVQCQALHTLEKLLPVFGPDDVDVTRFLRNILVVVAKVIVLQVRDKAAHTVSTAVMNDSIANAPADWRVDRVISPEIGKLTTQLMNNLCIGTFSLEWSLAIRRELASCLLNVVQLTSSISSSASKDSINRESLASFLASKRFWLSVSALALVKDKAWLSLTDKWNAIEAQREEQPDTLCENHDDGNTCAQVYCTVCETALCRECFTVMHLHKKNRTHRVQTLNHPTRPADIDIHQGCARMRLQQLLILFHGDSLNGLVEVSPDLFPSSSVVSHPYASTLSLSHPHNCRFCGNHLEINRQATGVCSHPDCQALAPTACEQVLPCGHYCGGISGEENCQPCLNCHAGGNEQDCDDVCVVCFTDRLGAAPSIKLGCGHLFHFHCLRTILDKKWNGPRIHFRFIHCPLCSQQLSHPGLADLLEPLLSLRDDVILKAKMRLEYDGLLQCQALTDEKSEYYNRADEYAMDRYMYVLCSKCKKAYFGGESRCQQALNSSQYNPDELICGGCSDTTGAQVCGRHGVEYLEYKCRFCCSIAVYFCFGTTHFCASCHDDFQRLMCLPKAHLPRCPAGPRGVELEEGPCPLRLQHPPTGEEFAMGCGICRNINTF